MVDEVSDSVGVGIAVMDGVVVSVFNLHAEGVMVKVAAGDVVVVCVVYDDSFSVGVEHTV